MTSQQITVLIILIVYLVANVVIGLVYGKVRDSRSSLSIAVSCTSVGGFADSVIHCKYPSRRETLCQLS